MLIYAHRGLSRDYPENTLLAFRQALACGADGIELDVYATADGIPVVIHDRSVERTTDGSGFVDELPLSRLQTFDAGHGERVPTLQQVLDVVGGDVHLDIEVKGSGIERETLGVLGAYPRARWAISSFDWEILRNVRRLSSSAELWPLAEQWRDAILDVASDLDSPAVALFTGAYDQQGADRLRAADLRVVVWTVNDPAEAWRVHDLGAYALCTDVPDRIIGELRNRIR
jgi:glycerophosphoryl diester phosphodiesterase